jgi:hypothetical protein
MGSPAVLTAPGQPGSFIGSGQPPVLTGYKQSSHVPISAVNGQPQMTATPQVLAIGRNSIHGQVRR